MVQEVDSHTLLKRASVPSWLTTASLTFAHRPEYGPVLSLPKLSFRCGVLRLVPPLCSVPARVRLTCHSLALLVTGKEDPYSQLMMVSREELVCQGAYPATSATFFKEACVEDACERKLWLRQTVWSMA